MRLTYRTHHSKERSVWPKILCFLARLAAHHFTGFTFLTQKKGWSLRTENSLKPFDHHVIYFVSSLEEMLALGLRTCWGLCHERWNQQCPQLSLYDIFNSGVFLSYCSSGLLQLDDRFVCYSNQNYIVCCVPPHTKNILVDLFRFFLFKKGLYQYNYESLIYMSSISVYWVSNLMWFLLQRSESNSRRYQCVRQHHSRLISSTSPSTSKMKIHKYWFN